MGQTQRSWAHSVGFPVALVFVGDRRRFNAVDLMALELLYRVADLERVSNPDPRCRSELNLAVTFISAAFLFI